MSARSRRSDPQVQLYRTSVLRSEQVAPSWQRVTVGGEELLDLPERGYDHWFRLFVPKPHQAELRLPELEGAQWWKPFLAIEEDVRPHCSNYTVAAHRPDRGEVDIDFVLHRAGTGELEGPAAIWACAARPGDPVALLDQGCLFEPPPDASSVVLAADETGLPGVAGILRSLPRDAVGHVIQEVPTQRDRRELDAPAGVAVTWLCREDLHAVPGTAALAELRRLGAVDPRAYAYVVGESALATGGRRLLRRWGLPKDRIMFSGYWKHG